MAPFTPYPYSIQAASYGQPMQQMYQTPTYQPQQPTPPNMAQEQPLYCRVVTSREEALAVPVEFSGRPMTLLDTAHGRVWIKTFNPATGSADLDEYCKVTNAATPEKPEAYATAAAVQELEQRVAALAEDLAKVRQRRRSHEREVIDDEI